VTDARKANNDHNLFRAEPWIAIDCRTEGALALRAQSLRVSVQRATAVRIRA